MASSSPKKRSVARSPEDLARKKDMILDAAMRLLTTRGYTKTTMTDVAREASVGRGTVYWHFPSKDELFLSLMLRETMKIESQLAGVLDVPGKATEKIDNLMRVGFLAYGEAPQLFQAFMSFLAGADPDTQHRLMGVMSGIYGKYNKLVEDLLEQGKREGEVRPDLDSHVVAAAYVVMLDAMFLQIEFGLVEYEPDRLGRSIVQAIRHGYEPDRNGGKR